MKLEKRQVLIPAALLLVTSACSSLDWPRSGPDPVDDSWAVQANEEERVRIAAARAERAEIEDDLAIHDARIDEELSRLELARQEVDVAEAEYDRAEAIIDAAEDDNVGTTEDADESLTRARAQSRWAAALVELQEARLEYARSQRALVEERIDLADEQVELLKAEVMASNGADEGEDINLTPYYVAVDKAAIDVDFAAIDRDAWYQKVSTLQERRDELAGEVPEARRDTWTSNLETDTEVRNASSPREGSMPRN